MNAQTAMQFNDYMYAVNKRNAATELARRQQQQKNVNESADATYKRLHDAPDPHDVHTGDALNIVLTELVNPKVYTQVVQKAMTPIDSQLVKIAALRRMIDALGRQIDLEVDGGVNPEKAKRCIEAGADALVAGTAVFGGGPGRYAANIKALRG